MDIATQEVVHQGRADVFVFVPATPNPTNGYLVHVPEADLFDVRIRPEENDRRHPFGRRCRPAATRQSCQNGGGSYRSKDDVIFL